MEVYKYKDYDEYVAAQLEANYRKECSVWVTPNIIEAVASYCSEAESILCHGTRNGAEQRYFKSLFPEAEVIGTEISESGVKYGMTLHHDFNKPLPDGSKYDIVYSNAFDHSPDPDNTLKVWFDQVSDSGHLVIDYSFGKKWNTSKASDPLSISYEELLNLASQYGKLEHVWHNDRPQRENYVMFFTKK